MLFQIYPVSGLPEDEILPLAQSFKLIDVPTLPKPELGGQAVYHHDIDTTVMAPIR